MKKRYVVGGVVVAGVAGIAIASGGGGGGTHSPPSTQSTHSTAPESHSAAPKKEAPKKEDTVTYVVTGSAGASVMWGPSGSSYNGTSPMKVTRTLKGDPPTYMAINAQLNGGGSVACEIRINGKVVSHGEANGGYNIATCEVVHGLFGGWDDAN